MPSNDMPERHDRNEGTRESWANELHERAQNHPRVTALHFLIRARLPERDLARTTRPNELTWMPSNDPPERHDRNEGTRESQGNELHERSQIQPRVTT